MSKSITIKKKKINEKDLVIYDSDSDSEKELPQKVVPKKSAKKVLKKDIKNDTHDNKLEENIPSIEQLLTNRNYNDLAKYIPKYKNITSSDVNKIINSKPQKQNVNYNNQMFYDMELMEDLLEKIIDNGYVMKKENYIELMRQYENNYWRIKKISSLKILKNFKIEESEISEWSKFLRKVSSNSFFFEWKSLNLDDKKTLENIFCVLISIGSYCSQGFINETKFSITENCLQYAKSVYDKKYIREKIKSQISEIKKINTDVKDNELLKCKSIEEIEEYVDKNDYEITAQTIILACQNNIDKNIINHLLSYKINFDEESVNNIIKSYRENENLNRLLLLISQYGYQFKKNNYIEMFTSKHYAYLFSDKNVSKNLILDDKMVECAYNANKKFTHNSESIFEKFLEDLEFLMDQIINQDHVATNIEGIIILYCSIGNTNKIKNLTKKYKFKLNTKCLKYLYKDKANITKKNIELFKNDKVIPDTEVLLQYMETFVSGAKQIYLCELLGI
jgi:hypothetical protein